MATYYFDMDDTIAGLSAVPNWIMKLRAGETSPYTDAAPLFRVDEFERFLHGVGHRVGIVTWGPMGVGYGEHLDRVAAAKIEWLERHGFSADEIHVVPYGTPKWTVVDDGDGVLVDDSAANLADWRAAGGEAIDASDTSKMLIDVFLHALAA